MMGTVFEVGQKVTVCEHYGSKPSAITAVAAVNKRKLTLANGREYTADGRKTWGSGSDNWYTGTYVREWRDGDDEALARKKALEVALRFSQWEKLPTEDLQTVAAIIRKSREVPNEAWRSRRPDFDRGRPATLDLAPGDYEDLDRLDALLAEHEKEQG